MRFNKSLLAAAALAASFTAGAQVTGSLGGGTGTFLSLSGGASPSGSPDSCTTTSSCSLGGTFASIVGGATLTGEAPFADGNAFATNGGIFGGTFLATGPTVGNVSTLTFSNPVSYVSFLWGSPDLFNAVTVNSVGGSAQTFDIGGTHAGATDLGFASTNGNQSFSQYVQFAGNGITSLVFTNTPTNNAFEVANFSVLAAVPEPETYALMLAGLGAISFMARRRRQVQ